VHDKRLEAALDQKCGMKREVDLEAFEEDVRMLRLLAKLPTLDPFLIRDTLELEGISVNERYCDISDAQWEEIQSSIYQRFTPLLRAAYPDAKEFRGKARRLLACLWEAKDFETLAPVIKAFGLPEDGALEILYAWKVVTFYVYQYLRLQPKLLALAQWLKESAAPASAPARALREVVRSELRTQWSRVDKIVADHDRSYDRMFVQRSETGPFLGFLRNCRATFWEIGDALGKVDHTVYCWDTITRRYPLRHVHPVDVLEGTFAVLAEILGTGLEGEPVAALG